MHYSLNRSLKNAGKFEMCTAPKFIQSKVTFEPAMKELKSLGFGYVVNHSEITSQGYNIY